MTPQTRETAGVFGGLVGSMLLAMLLLFAMTGGGFFVALLVLALLPVALGALALEGAAQYSPVLSETATATTATAATAARPVAARAASRSQQPILVGVLSTVAIFGVFFNGMAAWEGLPHAMWHLTADGGSIIAVMASFGILVGTATQASTERHISGLLLAIGAVGSALGMLGLFACCTPLLVHFFPAQIVLPAAILVMQYSVPIVTLGVVASMVASIAMERAGPATASA